MRSPVRRYDLHCANAFLFFDPCVDRFIRVLRAAHQGFWLGLLDREALRYVTENQYSTWEYYQRPAYNLSGLADWESAVLDRFFKECQSVLVGASGGGREVIALSRRCIRVDAFECSKTLLESSRNLLSTEGIRSRVVLSDSDQVPSQLGVYDGLIMGWGGYTHIVGRKARIAFLRQLKKHVRPGGPLLLSFLNRSETSKRHYWVFKIASYVQWVRGSRETAELGDALDRTFDHHFTEAEIRHEIEEAGFEFIYFSDLPYGHVVGRAGGQN